MSTSYKAVNVKCPFYVSEDKLKITCEGHSEKCTFTSNFANAKNKELHKNKLCDHFKYVNCPVYQMILEKYEKKENK